ncbi:MAG: sensor histidine kinase [Parasporobacterium sp.]|nr:sensor histidine kinase [Parasporobacterium sp.]
MLVTTTRLLIQNIISDNLIQLAIAMVVFFSICRINVKYRLKTGIFIAAMAGLSVLENLLLGSPYTVWVETANYLIFAAAGFLFAHVFLKFTLARAAFVVLCAIVLQNCGASAQFLQRIAILETGVPPEVVFESIILNAVQFYLVYYLMYLLFIRKLRVYGSSIQTEKTSILSTFCVLPILLLLSAASKTFAGKYDDAMIFMCFQLFVLVLCVYILWMLLYQARLLYVHNEMKEQETIIQKQKLQFSFSKKNIDDLNKKCHDMKHQISALRQMNSDVARDSYIKSIEEDLQNYDAFIKTGNETVDVVLTEKNLYCKQNGISLACIVDGKLLEMLDIIDLYTILGNALDNAVECVMKICEAEKRYISLKAFRYQQFLQIQVENYCESFPEMEDGMPRTTKSDPENHGYGIKSIKLCVEKYGGFMTISQKDEMFSLQILIPVRE